MTTKLMNHTTFPPNTCYRKPCIRGMRFPVEVVLDRLGSGMTMEEILEDQKEDVLVCLKEVVKTR